MGFAMVCLLVLAGPEEDLAIERATLETIEARIAGKTLNRQGQVFQIFALPNTTAADFVAMAKFKKLAHLSIDDMVFSKEIVESIAGLRELEWLSLSSAVIDDGVNLQAWSNLKKLRHFAITRSDVSKVRFDWLAGDREFGEVFLGRCAFSKETFRSLSNCKFNKMTLVRGDYSTEDFCEFRPKSLRSLWCTDHEMGDAGAAHIATFPGIEVAILSSTSVTDRGLLILAKVDSVKRIFVSDTKVTEEGIKEARALRKSLVVEGGSGK